jgi:hypothetical protein
MAIQNSQHEEIKFLGPGKLAYVFRVMDKLALKIAKVSGDKRFEQENKIFDKLESCRHCPHIIYSLFRLTDINFLEYCVIDEFAVIMCAALESRTAADCVRGVTLERSSLVFT